MLRRLVRKKAIDLHNRSYSDISLYRTLNTLDLILMGIGAIIGAGVFVLTGIAAATQAGPAVVFSYLFAGIAALFAALSYAELASSIGGTGSAYSYAYIGLGEFIAWLIGWNLILEYTVAVSTVAIGWSGYVKNFFEAISLPIPARFTSDPFNGGTVNLIAVLIILTLALLSCYGVKQSARLNAAAVFVKLLTIIIFVIVAAGNVNSENWQNFLPFGWSGVMGGAALVFFAYIGFDALSTAVEESINPQRDIPIGIIVSLLICTAIYILVAGLLTSIVPYTTLNVKSPVSDALLNIGHRTAAGFIAAGAIAGLTTVMLVMYYGLTRICLAMARDGLIPHSIAKINPITHTPIRISIITALIIAAIAGFVPIGHAAEMVNIGTLAAFTFVCAGVMLFRWTHPDIERPFKLPYNPLIPLLGMCSCIYLMLHLPAITWWRFLIWTILGIIIYFIYGMRNSLADEVSS